MHVVTVLPGFVYTKMTEHLQLPKLLTAQPAEVGDGYLQCSASKEKYHLRKMVLAVDHAGDRLHSGTYF